MMREGDVEHREKPSFVEISLLSRFSRFSALYTNLFLPWSVSPSRCA